MTHLNIYMYCISCFIAFDVVDYAGNNAMSFCFALELFSAECGDITQA